MESLNIEKFTEFKRTITWIEATYKYNKHKASHGITETNASYSYSYWNETDNDWLIENNIKCIRIENSAKRRFTENSSNHRIIESILIVDKLKANSTSW
jgi:hypothetical protein